MRARLLSLLAGCLCLGIGGTAAAAQGTVIWKNKDCAYFLLQTVRGYRLFEWMAGAAPNDGDVIEGDMETRGVLQFHNRTVDLPVTAFIKAGSKSRDEVEKSIPQRCQ
jgi:hypothetical protein